MRDLKDYRGRLRGLIHNDTNRYGLEKPVLRGLGLIAAPSTARVGECFMQDDMLHKTKITRNTKNRQPVLSSEELLSRPLSHGTRKPPPPPQNLIKYF
jgi:hypothetical protein